MARLGKRKARWLIGLVAFFGLAVLALAVGFGLRLWLSPLAVYEAASRRALDKLGLERREIDLPTGRLVLWDGGQGPLVVLVHGAGHQAGVWADVAEVLMERHRLLVVDLPGHGDSTPQEGPITAADLYGGLEALLERHRDDQPVVVGNSLGAWLAMVYAHRHPDGLSRVVAVNGGALTSDLNGLSLVPQDREEARRLVEALRDPASPEIPDFVLDDLVDRSKDGPVARMMGDVTGLTGMVLDGRLNELTVPVDVVWGESDRLMPLAYAERMTRELPRGRLTEIPSCGHMPHSECPDRFVDTLCQVLESPPPAEEGTPTDPRPEEDPTEEDLA
jgi:pimeloyl-ACP methyl ester carboxylesterase